MSKAKDLYKNQQYDELLIYLLQQCRRVSDFQEYSSLCRWRRKIQDKVKPDHQKTIRVALLGSATTEFIEQPLRLELETLGLNCVLHISDYDTYAPEMLDPESESATFKPDIAILLLTPFSISQWPEIGDSADDVASQAAQVSERILGLCHSFHQSTNSEIILNNFHVLPLRESGNLGSRLGWDRNHYIRQVNQHLSDSAGEYVHILDVDMLSSMHGIDNWFDLRFWHHSKQPVSFNCIIPYVRNLAAMIGGIYGTTAKCIVLDLDNTLWGGVVGDDGIEGIKIGEGDAVSESFKYFQQYLLSLKQRGVLLAVCSKNEEANALAPFEQLDEMVLRTDDFVSFKANWETKPDNIQTIAKELNIGLDAIVFVDDNPAEREHIRQVLPQVKVLELSDDPSEYAELLDRSGWLEPVRLTDEDRQKTEQYRKNARRQEMQSAHTDYASYLRSLEQEATIAPFDTANLDRITQLINKTNQFNLTTLRLNRTEVEQLMDDGKSFTAYVKLKDCFGDNGLISVMAGHIGGDRLHIDLWLMSCRVFKRGVENLLANYLFDFAIKNEINYVEGVYKPTAKNGLVKDLYQNLGFSPVSQDDTVNTCWQINVKDYRPADVYINLAEANRT